MADVSGPTGWLPVFGLVPGASVQWGFIGYSCGSQPTVIDGLVTTMATRIGSAVVQATSRSESFGYVARARLRRP